MRLFIRKGRFVQPVYVCDAQQFVESEDYRLAMAKHVKPCGSVQNMYIDFENTRIPVTDVSEIRVLSQMAAAYHNACLAENLAGEKDLYGMPYDATKWPEIVTENNNMPGKLAIDKVTPYLNTKGKITNGKIAQSIKNVSVRARDTRTTKKSSKVDEREWDEELHGERIVFDSTYELNEHLVPWLMDPDMWEEKYGMY
jgi:hypothetical protein